MAVRPFRVVSICAGVGGIELGFKLAIPSTRVVCLVEREAYAVAVLASRMADKTLDEAPIWSDVGTFDGSAWRGRVDAVMGGIPCQPWSSAGRRKGTEDERWIWPDIARVIRDMGPRFVFLENSPGLALGGLSHVLRDLAEMGFDAEWDVFSAAEAGASHERKRIFIFAVDDAMRRRYGYKDEAIRAGRNCPFDAGALPLFPPLPGDIEAWSEVLRCAPALEPTVRRVANGMAPSLDVRLRSFNQWKVRHEQALESLIAQSRSTGGLTREMREVWDRRTGAAPSPGLQQTDRGDSALSDLSQERAHADGNVGQRISTSSELRGVRKDVSADEAEDIDALRRSDMPINLWAPDGCEAMGCSCSRVDRVRAIGNGVVPLVVAFALISLARALGCLEEMGGIA